MALYSKYIDRACENLGVSSKKKDKKDKTEKRDIDKEEYKPLDLKLGNKDTINLTTKDDPYVKEILSRRK